MRNIKIIIPARYSSKRLPGKPLKLINGKELVLHVAERCSKVFGVKNLIIATDSKKIKSKVEKKGFNSIITSKKCLTGTDRVAEASKKIKSKIYINVQGDEPLIKTNDIKKVYSAKKKNPNHVICGYSEISKREDPHNTNIPKVILNKHSELIYISRALIPASKKKLRNFKFLKQVCIYAFNIK